MSETLNNNNNNKIFINKSNNIKMSDDIIYIRAIIKYYKRDYYIVTNYDMPILGDKILTNDGVLSFKKMSNFYYTVEENNKNYLVADKILAFPENLPKGFDKKSSNSIYIKCLIHKTCLCKQDLDKLMCPNSIENNLSKSYDCKIDKKSFYVKLNDNIIEEYSKM